MRSILPYDSFSYIPFTTCTFTFYLHLHVHTCTYYMYTYLYMFMWLTHKWSAFANFPVSALIFVYVHIYTCTRVDMAHTYMYVFSHTIHASLLLHVDVLVTNTMELVKSLLLPCSHTHSTSVTHRCIGDPHHGVSKGFTIAMLTHPTSVTHGCIGDPTMESVKALLSPCSHTHSTSGTHGCIGDPHHGFSKDFTIAMLTHSFYFC